MSRVCIDTSAYCHFRRGEPRVVAEIDRADWIGVPAVVVGELWAGFLRGSQRERNIAELRTFLDHSLVEVRPVDAEVAEIYGEIVVDQRRRGVPLPANDVWIAATAARSAAAVLTFDAHFEKIPRVGALVL